MNRPAEVVVHRLQPVVLRRPFSRYLEALEDRSHGFLLDSALGHPPRGRFSFLGAAPELVVTARRALGHRPGQAAHFELSRPTLGSAVEHVTAEPWEFLERLFTTRRVPAGVFQPSELPFRAGAVGYFGYECGTFIERLPDLAEDRAPLPDLALMFVDSVLAHDQLSGQTFISAIGRGATQGEAQASLEAAIARWEGCVRRFEASPDPHPDRGRASEASPGLQRRRLDPAQVPGLEAALSPERYRSIVEAARQHILAGDVFEVCTTNRFTAPFFGDPRRLYLALRRTSPAPFAAYLELPFAQVVSSSPERFLSLSADGIAESRPIKGTRPRGATPEEDQALKQELETSAKDRAENLMIVDLVRNDLGRVCRIGSVEVPRLLEVESYATVHQLVSTVRGRLEPGKTALDLLSSCFPGGSMTGAPKVEAMKIIEALEPVKRGIYSGALGWLDAGGAMDLSMVIRTLVVREGQVSFGVGGAVVADSDPAGEQEETLHKAQAMLLALADAEGQR